MNIGARRRHRWMTRLFVILAPAILAVGIFYREPLQAGPVEIPIQEDWAKYEIVVKAFPRLWADLDVDVSLMAQADDAQSKVLVLSSSDHSLVPDLLLYWIPESELSALPSDPLDGVEDPLPAGSVLLGSFQQSAPTYFKVPAALGKGRGGLVLYSLVYREIVYLSESISFEP